jgi:hypothetical protein
MTRELRVAKNIVFILFCLTMLLGVLLSGSGLPGASRSGREDWLFRLTGWTVVATRGDLAQSREFHAGFGTTPFFREPFCITCHPLVPHARSVRDRSILNYHATRVHCLICHGRGFVNLARDLAWKDKVLWPSTGGGWLSSEREKEWREQAAQKAPCFSVGPACTDCHSPSGLLAWGSLGYETKRATRLGKLEEFFFKIPPDSWFFPSIM